MNYRRAIKVFVVIGLTIVGSAGIASETGRWLLAAAPNGNFSVETPCDAARVADLQRVPNSALGNLEFMPQARVICRTDKFMFMAGEVEVAAVRPTGPSFFDAFVARTLKDPTLEGKPLRSTIGGRRAFLNRQEKDGVLAQSGFVEVSRKKVVVLMGVGSDSSVPIAEQGKAVDRFYSSLRVVGK